MHTETISDALWGLLVKLNKIPEMKFAYLGGGTGLSLQTGHRKSEDLDFYVSEEFSFDSFNRNIRDMGLEIIVSSMTRRHTRLMIQSVKVDLINETVSLRFPLKPLCEDIQDIRLADPRDIGRMKIIAIGSRGSKKDFIDLYFITRTIIRLDDLIALSMEENQGIKYERLLFLKGLVDFEEADLDPEPVMLLNISWDEVKGILKKEVIRIAESFK
jgi:hypothetical protein